MFKNFHGFQLVDEYHRWKKEHRQNNNPLQIQADYSDYRYTFLLDRADIFFQYNGFNCR